MDDRHIEDILKRSWSPEPPNGMRDRILRRSREEMERKRPIFFRSLSWKLALCCIAIAVVLMTNISDGRRQARMEAMIEQGPGPRCSMVAERPETLGEWRRDMNRLLEWDSSDVRARIR